MATSNTIARGSNPRKGTTKFHPRLTPTMAKKQAEDAQAADAQAKAIQDANPEVATGFQTEEQKAIQQPSTTDAQKVQAAAIEQNEAQPEATSFATYGRGYQADKAAPLEGVQHNLSGLQVLQAQAEYVAKIEAEKEAQAQGKEVAPTDKLLTSTKE
jgi:hypothetical protein